MKMIQVPKMLPCPFCGKKPSAASIIWKNPESRFECSRCGALGPFPKRSRDYPRRDPSLCSNTEAKIRDREAAIAWNRRA